MLSVSLGKINKRDAGPDLNHKRPFDVLFARPFPVLNSDFNLELRVKLFAFFNAQIHGCCKFLTGKNSVNTDLILFSL